MNAQANGNVVPEQPPYYNQGETLAKLKDEYMGFDMNIKPR